MKYLSVCSGIEAATVAWHPLGWQPLAFAEIEPFPSAVLAHHWPEVPNLGDMTNYGNWPSIRPDIIVGGTPCQAFSVAGMRRGLADARGNLALTFCQLADHFDPEWIVWENVPGVLSSKDNAFGCFLAGLCGASDPIVPVRRWANAGMVSGPKRTVAWRILDAQFFGVAQRRRRVFVVAVRGPGNWRSAAALFPVSDGLHWDSPPSRKTREGIAGTITGGARKRGGCSADDIPAVTGTLQANGKAAGSATQQDAESGMLVAFGGNNTAGEIDVAAALNANRGCHNPGDFEAGTLITHALRGEGFDASEDGTGRGTPIVPCSPPLTSNPYGDNASREGVLVPVAFSGRARGDDGRGYDRPPQVFGSEAVGALDTVKPHCIAFDTTQITSAANRSNPQQGDPCHPLAAGAHPPAIAFPAQMSGTQFAATEDLAPNLQAKNPTAIAFSCKDSGADADEVAPTLRSMGHKDSHQNGGVQIAVAFNLRGREGGAMPEVDPDGRACQRAASGGSSRSYVATSAVRRLTPRECERLQGFPDDHTRIPTWDGWRPMDESETPEQCIAQGLEVRQSHASKKWRVKDPDGPRYKAIGNSMAVPVMRWLGERIQLIRDLERIPS